MAYYNPKSQPFFGTPGVPSAYSTQTPPDAPDTSQLQDIQKQLVATDTTASKQREDSAFQNLLDAIKAAGNVQDEPMPAVPKLNDTRLGLAAIGSLLEADTDPTHRTTVNDAFDRLVNMQLARPMAEYQQQTQAVQQKNAQNTRKASAAVQGAQAAYNVAAKSSSDAETNRIKLLDLQRKTAQSIINTETKNYVAKLGYDARLATSPVVQSLKIMDDWRNHKIDDETRDTLLSSIGEDPYSSAETKAKVEKIQKETEWIDFEHELDASKVQLSLAMLQETLNNDAMRQWEAVTGMGLKVDQMNLQLYQYGLSVASHYDDVSAKAETAASALDKDVGELDTKLTTAKGDLAALQAIQKSGIDPRTGKPVKDRGLIDSMVKSAEATVATLQAQRNDKFTRAQAGHTYATTMKAKADDFRSKLAAPQLGGGVGQPPQRSKVDIGSVPKPHKSGTGSSEYSPIFVTPEGLPVQEKAGPNDAHGKIGNGNPFMQIVKKYRGG